MAKGFELEGKLKVVDEIQTFASGFSKREFVVEVEDGKYPQLIKFDLLKEKTSLTDNFQLGDTLHVHFDIGGREYNGRYFVNLNAWKVERAGGGSAPTSSDDPGSVSEPPPGYGQESEGDDIPF